MRYFCRDIDGAFLRRFERKILIDIPTEENRISIVKKLLPSANNWTEIEMSEFARVTDGFTGSDLKIASKEAVLKKIDELMEIEGDLSKQNITVSFREFMVAVDQIKPTMIELAAKHRQWNAKFGNQLNL